MSTIHHAALRRALSVASLITFAAMPLAAQRPSATPPDYSAPADAPANAAAFVEAGNRDVLAGIIPYVNHLFVYDVDGFPGNYAKLPPLPSGFRSSD